MYCLSCFFRVCVVLLRRWAGFKLTHGRNIFQRHCRLSARGESDLSTVGCRMHKLYLVNSGVILKMNANVYLEMQVQAHSTRWESTHQTSIVVWNETWPHAESHSSRYTADNVWNAKHRRRRQNTFPLRNVQLPRVDRKFDRCSNYAIITFTLSISRSVINRRSTAGDTTLTQEHRQLVWHKSRPSIGMNVRRHTKQRKKLVEMN